jgi:hypothetical protein
MSPQAGLLMSFRKLVMWAESIAVDPFHVSPARFLVIDWMYKGR